MGSNTYRRPAVTPAQIIGLLIGGLPILANLLRAFGVYDLTLEQQRALEDTLQWGALIAGSLFVADAGLRASRNHAESAARELSTPIAPENVSLTPAPAVAKKPHARKRTP
jgi:hypothetical protein